MSIVYLEHSLVLLSVVAWLYEVQLQAVIENPLASPDVIGISKGASLAAVIIIMIFQQHHCLYYLGFFHL